MRKMMIFGSIVLSLLGLGPYGFADEGEKSATQSTHMKVHGVVSKVGSGLITIKTSWGSMTIASTFTPLHLNVGEEVDMQVNENNAVIDVHRKGDHTHAHRFVSGNLTYTSSDRREVKLWTPEGEKTIDVQAGRSKLAPIEEGAPVTIELNEAGDMIDIHRFTMEVTVGERPRTKPGHQMTVHGVVEKIQSGVIFAKTPFARYHLSVNTAPSGIQAGDEITLWVNEDNIVIDHHMKGHQQAHRLVSGKLIYVGRNKKQIKLWTPEGEKVFPLERLEVKAKPIKEGSMITIELNENGTVVDLWKAS
jgi:hypothetical protein